MWSILEIFHVHFRRICVLLLLGGGQLDGMQAVPAPSVPSLSSIKQYSSPPVSCSSSVSGEEATVTGCGFCYLQHAKNKRILKGRSTVGRTSGLFPGCPRPWKAGHSVSSPGLTCSSCRLTCLTQTGKASEWTLARHWAGRTPTLCSEIHSQGLCFMWSFGPSPGSGHCG